MKVLGIEIPPLFTKAPVSPWNETAWKVVHEEGNTGDWQRSIFTRKDNVLNFGPAYACVKLISDDASKLRLCMKRRVQTEDGPVWIEEVTNNRIAHNPNDYQTTAEFFRSWVLSKYIHGNAYILIGPNGDYHVLDGGRTKAYVEDDGSVFYRTPADQLSQLGGETDYLIPSSQIMHDKISPLYHPLMGISPISAAYLTARGGMEIQKNAFNFFRNGARPSGIITLPSSGRKNENREKMKKQWEQSYSKGNIGRVAVMTGDVKYHPMGMTSTDAQLIEQLKLSSEMICQVFLVPPFKVGVGSAPPYNNVEALNLQYYTDCLQKVIEDIEATLHKGLGLLRTVKLEFDTDALLRMDKKTQSEVNGAGVKHGYIKVNEARQRENRLPVPGGEHPYMQQQNYPVKDLAERGVGGLVAATQNPPAEKSAANDDNLSDEVQAAYAAQLLERALAENGN